MITQGVDAWLAHIERLHHQSIELGLERVEAVRARLDRPQRFPVITVGGTNGKGSVCAMLESILRAAGYRVGCYTSPHLLRYNERVRVNGEQVGDDTLCRGFEIVERVRGNTPLTYFEFGTLAAWAIFCDAEVDVAILEVGLGGRLDAVNIFDADCAVVTSIDIDHTEYLGESREKIAYEKAGIFRKDRPAIVADFSPPESLLQHADKTGAQLQLIQRDFGFRTDMQQWQYWRRNQDNSHESRRSGLAYPGLRGAIQLVNAATAIATLDAMSDHLPIAMQDIRRGLLEVALPGRFQLIPGRPTIVLDVGHNAQAARVLAENLSNMPPPMHTYAVFGMMNDKDIASVVSQLKPYIDRWFCTALPLSRGASTDALSEILNAECCDVAGCYDSPALAFHAAQEVAGENDRILVFGSFLTVADVIREQSLLR